MIPHWKSFIFLNVKHFFRPSKISKHVINHKVKQISETKNNKLNGISIFFDLLLDEKRIIKDDILFEINKNIQINDVKILLSTLKENYINGVLQGESIRNIKFTYPCLDKNKNKMVFNKIVSVKEIFKYENGLKSGKCICLSNSYDEYHKTKLYSTHEMNFKNGNLNGEYKLTVTVVKNEKVNKYVFLNGHFRDGKRNGLWKMLNENNLEHEIMILYNMDEIIKIVNNK